MFHSTRWQVYCSLYFLLVARVFVAGYWISVERSPIWERSELNSDHPIHLSAFNSDACVFDKTRLQWRMQVRGDNYSFPSSYFRHTYLIHASEENSQTAVAAPLGALVSRKIALRDQNLQYKIRCVESADIFCQPTAKTITLLKDVNIISITFSENTTMPVVPLDLLQESITIIPNVIMRPTRLQWLTASSAHVHVDAADMENLISVFQQNQSDVSIFVTPIDTTSSLFHQGQKTLRLMRPSTSSLFFIDGENGKRVSNIVKLQVRHCRDDDDYDDDALDSSSSDLSVGASNTLPFPSRKTDGFDSFPSALTKSVIHLDNMKRKRDMPLTKNELEAFAHAKRAQFSLQGIWAVRGKDAIQITHKAAPALNEGTWSLSMWIRLLEAPTGSFRALLYKGDITNQDVTYQRTPSLWLLPNSNHLSLRFSTIAFHDHAVSSVRELPMNQWTHLVLTLENITHSRSALTVDAQNTSRVSSINATKSTGLDVVMPQATDQSTNNQVVDDGSASFRFRLFLNGQVDVEGVAGITDPVIGNMHPLQLFYDYTFSGPKSFVQGIQVWDGVLSAEDVLQQYLKGVQGNRPVDNALDLFTRANSPLIPFVQQWQRYHHSFSNEEKQEKQYMLPYVKEARLRCLDVAPVEFSSTSTDQSNTTTTSTDKDKTDTHETTVVNEHGEMKEVLVKRMSEEETDFVDDVEVDSFPPAMISDNLQSYFAQKSQESIAQCDGYDTGLDIHAQAAELGSRRSLVYWSKLLLLGHEVSDSKCGFVATVKDVQNALLKQQRGVDTARGNDHLSMNEKSRRSNVEKKVSVKEIPSLLRTVNSAVAGLLLALDAGDETALMPLAVLSLQGCIGLESVISGYSEDNLAEKAEFWLQEDWQLPWKPSYKKRNPDYKMKEHQLFKPANFAKALTSFLRHQQVHFMREHYDQYEKTDNNKMTNNETSFSEFFDLLVQNEHPPFDSHKKKNTRYHRRMNAWSNQPTNTFLWQTLHDLGVGMLYIAAMHGDVEAQVALSYRYQRHLDNVFAFETSTLNHPLSIESELSSENNQRNSKILTGDQDETAAWYAAQPVRHTAQYFQLMGAQAVVEAHRINDDTVRDLAKGNLGQEDELIEMQRIRAKEGDVTAMLAMGDLYYYGARGLPQDHAQAFQYFRQAAERGDPQGMCGVANMYLKGEGTPQNTSAAIAWYENATVLDSVRAYNGLGYMYFYGQQVAQNHTKALQYFVHAASYENDGDSLFNAAYCLEQGYGIDVNDASLTAEEIRMKRDKALQKAVYFYQIAARKLGHFGSIQALGFMHLEGRGVDRSAVTALQYFSPAMTIGPWASWLRRGFDLFLIAKEMTSPTSSSLSATSSITSWVTSWSKYFTGDSPSLSKYETHHLQDSLYLQSLLCYLYIGELGQEVAQSNAAYILRTKLLPSLIAVENQRVQSALLGYSVNTASALSHSLLAQYVRTAEVHQQADAWVQLGNLFFPKHKHQQGKSSDMVTVPLSPSSPNSDGLKDNDLQMMVYLLQERNSSVDGRLWIKPSYAHALYCYQRAVALSAHPIALVYLGVMHHFALGVDKAQPIRAARYYTWAMQTAQEGQQQSSMKLTSQMRWVVASLQQALSWASSSSSGEKQPQQPLQDSILHGGLEYVVKMLWE